MLYHDWNKKAWLAGSLLMLAILTLILSRIPSCGSHKPEPPAGDDAVDGSTVTPTDTDTSTDTGGGDGGNPACGDIGDSRLLTCPSGQVGDIVQVCTETGWKTASDTCKKPGDPGNPTCTHPVFADVKPILQAKCISCHVSPGQITDYAVAAQWSDDIARRIALPSNNNEHMPKGTAPQLSPDEISKIRGWHDAGSPNGCDSGSNNGFLNLDSVEGAIVADLNTVSEIDRPNVRYLVASHAFDAGAANFAGPDLVKKFFTAVNKGLNVLNDESEDLFIAQPIDGPGTIFRFDLRTFDMNVGDWGALETADRLETISQTTKGQIIRALTRTNKPYFHADNFLNVAIGNPTIYYRITETPAKAIDLQAKVDTQFNNSVGQFDATFAGSATSPIALQKNRLIVRVDQTRTQNAYYWQTFDINGQFANLKNLFQFPLLGATGTQNAFQFDASEVIYTMPNGMQGYALFNNQGVLQNAAPGDVVRDVESPISPIISNAGSCQRCHSGGLIPMQDQILGHVKANASQFPANDVAIIERLYKAPGALSATFVHDNGIFAKALKAIGVDPLAPDPITELTDRLQLNWDLNLAASFLFLTKAQFLQALEQSAFAKGQIGQLATGGTVTFGQFQAVLPQLVKDARLFQDPLGQ